MKKFKYDKTNMEKDCKCHCHSDEDGKLAAQGIQCKCIKNCEHCHPENFQNKVEKECLCHCHAISEKPRNDPHNCEHCKPHLTPLESYFSALLLADFFKKRILEINRERWNAIKESVIEVIRKSEPEMLEKGDIEIDLMMLFKKKKDDETVI